MRRGATPRHRARAGPRSRWDRLPRPRSFERPRDLRDEVPDGEGASDGHDRRLPHEPAELVVQRREHALGLIRAAANALLDPLLDAADALGEVLLHGAARLLHVLLELRS